METKEAVPQYDPEGQPLAEKQSASPEQASRTSNRIDQFDGRKAIIFGAVMIVLVTVDIALNAGAFPLVARGRQFFFNLFIVIFPAGWNGIFIYITGAFAIAAGKTRIRCLIITNLVMSVIGAIFASILLVVSAFSLAYDSGDYNSSSSSYRNTVLGSLLISLAMVVIAIVLLVLCVYSAVLSGKVICCTQNTAATSEPMLLQMEPLGGASAADAVVPGQLMTDTDKRLITPPPPYEEPNE